MKKLKGLFSIRSIRLLPAAAMTLASVLVFAQFQVNRQLNVGGGPPSVRYASSPYAQRVDQSSAAMLPSQQRYAVMRSGAMPSEVRGAYMRTGPMAPSGAVAYLPSSNPGMSMPQRAVTSGNMVNAQAARSSTAMPGFTMPSAGSVKYTPGPITQSALTPASSLGLAAKAGVPAGQMPYGQNMTGSIRYGSQ